MSNEAAIALGSALLGAVVGGVASLAASLLVDRWRIRQEVRVRIYEELLYDAVGGAGRLCRLARERLIPGEADAALADVARVRRAAVIAGRRDVRVISSWLDEYASLTEIAIEFGRVRNQSGGVGGETLNPLFHRAEAASLQVLKGLHEYSKWLENRLAGRLAGPAFLDEENL
jgi:hypothetical protein